MKDTIQLPKTNKEGKPKISYSQYQSWNDLKSFNLGVDGKYEYMAKYFLGCNYKDKGWAEFGNDVEAYITLGEKSEKFNEKELFTLDKIQTLGNFQVEGEIDFGDFVLQLFIDDTLPDFKKIRDYKTASVNSKAKYYKDTYVQLDIYAKWVLQKYGFIPEAEVCIIERLGNCMHGGGRSKLSVGNSIWYNPVVCTEERMNVLEQDIRRVVHEISDHYKMYLLINK